MQFGLKRLIDDLGLFPPLSIIHSEPYLTFYLVNDFSTDINYNHTHKTYKIVRVTIILLVHLFYQIVALQRFRVMTTPMKADTYLNLMKKL